MNKRGKIRIIRLLTGILVAIPLAGCSLNLTPRNIPSTGGNPAGTPAATTAAQGAVTQTPGGAASSPTSTGAPTGTTAPAATSMPAATATSQPPAAQAPQATSAPAANSLPAATATPGPAISSIPLPAQFQTIQFPAGGTSFAVTTTLAQGTAKAYQLQASSGQRMYLTIDGNAVLQVYGPNQNALTGVQVAVNPVQVDLSQAGMYSIALLGSGPVTMSVYIPAAGSSQTIPAPIPAFRQQIRFPAGTISATFRVSMNPATPLSYTLIAQAGQEMTVTTTPSGASSGATVTLLAPDGATMVPSATMPTHQWRFILPQSGSYTMLLLGTGALSVSISIPAVLVGPTATAMPNPGGATRITFLPGDASTKRTVNLTAGQPRAFVLALQQGQTLFVSTTGDVRVTIYGPGNTVLVNGQSSFPNRWSASANQTGDYTFVISGSGSSALEFFVPPK